MFIYSYIHSKTHKDIKNISCIGGSKSSVQGRDSTGIDERGCGLVCECGEQSFKEMGWMKGNIMKN